MSERDTSDNEGDLDESGILSEDPIRRAVTVALLIALVGSVAGVAYIAMNPPETTDPYTELYILGSDGNASDYPTNLTVGETGTLIVGLTNHEHETTTYAIEARLNNRTVAERTPTVEDEETWESDVSFNAETTGRHQLRVHLYKDGTIEGDPDDFLRLWVTISEA